MKPTDNIIIHQIASNTILFDIQKSIQYSFNHVGSFILNQILKNKTSDEITLKLSKRYRIPYPQAEKDTVEFIQLLIHKKILHDNQKA